MKPADDWLGWLPVVFMVGALLAAAASLAFCDAPPVTVSVPKAGVE